MSRWPWAVGAVAILAAWKWGWPLLSAWLGRYDEPQWVAPVDLDGDGVDEAVVFYSGDGVSDRAVAWDLSGHRRWEAELPDLPTSTRPFGRADDVFFVGNYRQMLALDPETGVLRWATPLLDTSFYGVGCGSRIYTWGLNLARVDAATGARSEEQPGSGYPEVVCGSDGALILDDQVRGGVTRPIGRDGADAGPGPFANAVYVAEGVTQVLDAREARWVDGSVGDSPTPGTLRSWVRPDGGFVTVGWYSRLEACDWNGACRRGEIDEAIPGAGVTRQFRGRDGIHLDLLTPGRYFPAACRSTEETSSWTARLCVLDLDRLAIAAGPSDDVDLGMVRTGPNVFAVGERQVALVEMSKVQDALAVFDPSAGRFTRVVAVGDATGATETPYDLTVGRTAVFGRVYLSDGPHVFAFDPASGTIPWSEPPGVVPVDQPEVLAALPGVP